MSPRAHELMAASAHRRDLDVQTSANHFEQCFGGGKRDRTADLLHAMQALSQLSYTPARSTDRLYGSGLGEGRIKSPWDRLANPTALHPIESADASIPH